MPEKIEITNQTIFRIIFILLVLLFLFLIREVVLLLFVALVIATAISPAVDWLKKKKIPRVLSTFLIFLISLGLLSLVIYLLVPPLINQTTALIRHLPLYFQKLPFNLNVDYLQNFLEKIGNYLVGVPASISSIIIILIIVFYLLAQNHGIQNFIKIFTPIKHQDYALNLFCRIQKKMGHWLLGQLASSLLVAVLTFIGLFLMHVPYALVLALAVGIAEIVPFGPIIAFIPAGILGFMQSPLTGVLVVVLYLIVQQLEGHLIMPQIMKKAVGLNPVIVILAVLIGAKLAGIFGLLIAVPIATALSILIKDFIEQKKTRACSV